MRIVMIIVMMMIRTIIFIIIIGCPFDIAMLNAHGGLRRPTAMTDTPLARVRHE